jgi:hypothetical protein
MIQEDGLLSVRNKTFRPTRSGSGDAEASGHPLPLSHTLLDTLHRGQQARFRTFPILLGDGGSGFCCWQVGQQEGGVQVTLHRTDAAAALMKPLRQGLFDIGLTAVAILRQPGAGGGNFAQGAASLCNCAFQMGYKHPWGAQRHALAVELLPALK